MLHIECGMVLYEISMEGVEAKEQTIGPPTDAYKVTAGWHAFVIKLKERSLQC